MATSEAPSKSLIVEVDYRFSLQAFIRATHAAWKSQVVFQALTVMAVLLFIATTFVVGLGASLQAQIPSFAFLVLAVAFYYLYPMIAFARDPMHRLRRRFEFTKDALRYRLGDTESIIPWSGLKAAIESGEFYVLNLPEKQKVAVPKSAFGPGEEQRFRLLAATSGVPIH